MGDIYCRSIFGMKHPRVGLLSIGEEESTGYELTRVVFKRYNRLPINHVDNTDVGALLTDDNHVLRDLFRSIRSSPHRDFGRCPRCEEEAAARVKAEAEAVRQRMEIEETYKNMDEAKRDELTTLVKERAKREDLAIGPGDLEAAVVRMYKRSRQGN